MISIYMQISNAYQLLIKNNVILISVCVGALKTLKVNIVICKKIMIT